MFQSVGCVTNFSFTQFNRIRIISLDAGLWLDGIPALDLWDLILSVLGNTTQNHDRKGKLVVGRNTHVTSQASNLEECSTF